MDLYAKAPHLLNYQDIVEIAGNKAETNKKLLARDCWGSEYPTTATVGATQQPWIDALPPQMRIDELPTRQPSIHWQPSPYGGFKPNTWPPR